MIDLQTLRAAFDQFRCLKPTQAPEVFGPTDVNAQTGNGGLSVALNRDGTITVLRWPRPSFYDQVKYHTRNRDRPRFGVAPNEGAFLGLRVERTTGDSRTTETTWLRDWDVEQRYAEDFSDVIRTRYESDRLGLTVEVRDVVARDEDALVRDVVVERSADSVVESATLLAFENLSLVVSKDVRDPAQDWCHEGDNTDVARYRADLDALIHAKSGRDRSTGEHVSVAFGLGFAGESAGHQVGTDAYEAMAADVFGGERDAYEDCLDGPLTGNDAYTGHTTGAIARDLAFDAGAETNGDVATATATVVLAAGPDAGNVADVLDAVRARAPAEIRAAKEAWLDEELGHAPMPDTDDEAVLAIARRALVTLLTNYDPESGAIVASIATQSPYALDWPRDGVFFNLVLDLLGHHEKVAKRNRWYADLQATEAGGVVPPGNWAMNYYADGVPGGPIPWEIDETGLCAWTLWDHYEATGDEAYLADVYPAIRRAADFLVAFRDPDTGLQKRAYEDDNVVPSKSVVGASTAWLGLDAAVEAARALGKDDDAARFADRRDEIGAAIDDRLWRPSTGAYSGRSPDLDWLHRLPVVGDLIAALPLVPDVEADPVLAWPAGFKSPADPRMASHLERVWEAIAPSFDVPDDGDRGSGLYETMGLAALGRAWRGDPERMAKLREGVHWVATEHATSDTRVMGEVWIRDGDEVVSTVSQPHTWAQVLFYVASLEAYPPVEVPDRDGEYASVFDVLRERQLADGRARQSLDG